MATIEKLSDDMFNGEHPNGIGKGFSKQGNIFGELAIGKRFMVGSLRTSTVTKLVSDTGTVAIFKTRNSTYKLIRTADEVMAQRAVKLPPEFKCDFLGVDQKSALSAEGILFRLGDKVTHVGDNEKRVGSILSFFIDPNTMDVKAYTEYGVGRICFLNH